MISSKHVEVSQKRCLGTSIENFTGSSPSEKVIMLSQFNKIIRGVVSEKQTLGDTKEEVEYFNASLINRISPKVQYRSLYHFLSHSVFK